MHLAAVFNEYGLDIEKTKIVRHPLNKRDIRDIYKLGMIEDYQLEKNKYVYSKYEKIYEAVSNEMYLKKGCYSENRY